MKLIISVLLSLLYVSNSCAAENPPFFTGSFGALNPAEMYPVDLAVDDGGNIYILDELNQRVHKKDQDNNLLLLFGSKGYEDGQFQLPRGLALDSEGYIYVSDCISNIIQKFDPSGSFVWKRGGTGIDNGQLRYPTGLAIGMSDQSIELIYVADRFNQRIQVFDKNGNFQFIFADSSILKAPEYIAIDSDKNLWVTDIGLNKVLKFDKNGNLLLGFGSWGTDPGQFMATSGITVDQEGFVYVFDRWNGRIQKFDQNGNFILMWGEIGSDDGQLHGLGLASDLDSNIYIADYWNFRVQKFNNSGQFLNKWAGTVTPDGEFALVHDVIVNHAGDIYVADRHNQNIQVFDSARNFLFKWGTRGEAAWEGPYFNFPRALAVDSADNIYISNDNDIRIFHPDGTFMDYWSIKEEGVPFKGPLGMTFDDNDHLFFTTADHQVEKMDIHGNLLAVWGAFGSDDGQFHSPSGIDADSAGNIYVCDTKNYRIQKFTNNGDFILSWGTYGYANGQFIKPVGLAVDPQDNVYVIDEKKCKVQKFDSQGNFICKWGERGEGDGEFRGPLYIAIDDSGKNIYITDSSNGRVQKFTYEPVSLELFPQATTVAQGDMLSFQAVLTNHTTEEQILTIATNVTLPNGTFYPQVPESLYGPEVLTLPDDGTSCSLVISHEIPGKAKPGTYTYHTYTGKNIPDDIWAEAQFEFTIF